MLEHFLSKDANNFRPSAIRAFARWINDPSVISFAGGSPNPATFPAAAFAEIAARVLRERPNIALQYGPTRGLARLCEFVAGRCGVKSEEVILTTGSQQALDLIAHALLDPGDVVAVELPTYIGGTSAFYARSARLAGVQQDDEGIVPESLDDVARAHRPKLLYVIPNFQNPSGRLMSQRRRDRVLELACKHDFLIIEDDPYGELVYVEGADTRSIRSRDRDGRVLYLGTFSKVLAPGVRCGWIAGPKELVDKFEIAKQAADLCSGMLDQSIIDEYCAAGALPAQIGRVRAFYRERRGVMIAALEKHFAGRAEWTSAGGGLFTFVMLQSDIDAASRVEAAAKNGVVFVPGAAFFVDGSGRNTMRLTFAKEPDDRIRDGIRRLAAVFA
ncbi:MAG TPA: PLP-dependent aminotransferase family protein [Thermoanaerobaculia bacterium]|nr:PLP-dependent aminotransferase family protein [Thermoanaerobaculia bacterium]